REGTLVGRGAAGQCNCCQAKPATARLDSTWDWLQLKRDAVGRIFGFFIGEAPVDPFGQSPTPAAPATALATAQPDPAQNNIALTYGAGRRAASEIWRKPTASPSTPSL